MLYISGEESLKQIKIRANRIGSIGDDFLLLCETNLAEVEDAIRRIRPDAAVIDSIQTMYSEEVSSAPGSVSQVREATNVFLQLAKGMNIPVFIVGHVTKEGTVAGPRVLEHMVDTVLYFEGDRHASYRILRGVKNRFGSTNEIGVFEMREEGLAEVENPSEFMLNGRPENASGSVVACSMEGTRPMLTEIQAMAIVSSFKNRAVDDKMLVFGEVGLSGEVRAVSMAGQRVAEARKLGFTTCVLPWVCADKMQAVEGMKIIGVKSVTDAIDLI